MRGYNYTSAGYGLASIPGHGYGNGHSYGYGYGSGYGSGYSYATIAAALEGESTVSRQHRSKTFIDKPSSSTHQAKRSRYRVESGPASPTVSPLQSGVSSPKGKASSESRRELRAAEADSKQSRDGRRRSTVPRHIKSRCRKPSEHKQSTRRKSHSEKKGVPKHSFASLTSRGTTSPTRSVRQRTKIKTCHKKSSGGYGLFSCFGR